MVSGIIERINMGRQNSKATTILGVKVHNVTLPQALRQAESFLYGSGQHYIVTPNPEIVLHAWRNPKYRTILNKASLSIPDGAGLLWASKKIYGRDAFKERITGVDFLIEFMGHLAKKSFPWESPKPKRILFLGGKNGAAYQTAEVLRKKFRWFHFYAIENHENKHLTFIVNEIIQPDCIFVALGAPKQEFWIHKNLPKFSMVKFAMGVGGAFDFISGKVPRSPFFMQKISAEWLWRFAVQPWRLPRIIRATIIFPLIVFIKTLK